MAKMVQNNPFLIEGYVSPEYFCDRAEETALLVRHLTNLSITTCPPPPSPCSTMPMTA